MPHQPLRRQPRVSLAERDDHGSERVELRGLVREHIEPLEFDAYGKIIAGFPAIIAGPARVPRSVIEADKLSQLAGARKQQMRGHAQRTDFLEIRVRIYRQRIREESFDPGPAKVARRQADAVHDNQVCFRTGRARIVVRRCDLPGAAHQAASKINLQMASPGLSGDRASICDNYRPMKANRKSPRGAAVTRVHVDGALHPGSILELARETASHLAKVLRARSGDELVLFNGDGREFTGTIEAVHGSRVCASIGAAREVSKESPLKVTLVQCIPRGDRMDFIVQKATELGVSRIVPVLSQRSVVRLDASQAESKRAHWRAVAVSACEQCGRNQLPLVEAPQGLLEFLGNLAPLTASDPALRWVLEPETTAPSRNSDLARSTEVAAIETAAIAIGPEGGFTPEELEAFELTAFTRAGLGPRILRTETAAIAAIAMLQTRFGDMSALADA